MRESKEIKRGLISMLEEESSVFQATVTAVNEEEFTCTVMEEEAVSYYDVRLRSVINPELNGMALIPKTGSYVLVCRIEKSNELFVCMFSEIDKIIFSNEHLNFTIDNETVNANINGTTIGITESGMIIQNQENKINCQLNNKTLLLEADGSKLNISNSGIVFNEGNNGAMVKIEALESNLNSLKAFVETMNSALPGALSAIGIGLSANGGTASSTYQASMSGQLINFTNMGNDKLKH